MGLFWLGASVGYFIKLGNSKSKRVTHFNRPWEFPIYMIVGGLFAVYFDWYRRIILEDVCDYEETVQTRIHAKNLMEQEVFYREPAIHRESHH
ncbi:hypothetical protein SteCoe_3870 [Stentor coeruleus]|uniref:Uncharacterized protein n=1 Tax=Stentor coeruleus TaxID=5963 RepID=A0A1R2CVZ5_9CILI|nr:hypothetical protein SteCoe_3870 [Stentor coeruleus]